MSSLEERAGLMNCTTLNRLACQEAGNALISEPLAVDFARSHRGIDINPILSSRKEGLVSPVATCMRRQKCS